MTSKQILLDLPIPIETPRLIMRPWLFGCFLGLQKCKPANLMALFEDGFLNLVRGEHEFPVVFVEPDSADAFAAFEILGFSEAGFWHDLSISLVLNSYIPPPIFPLERFPLSKRLSPRGEADFVITLHLDPVRHFMPLSLQAANS